MSANSCNPIDYPDYFGGSNSDNEILPEEFWNSQLRFCNYPLPLDGSRGFLKPEQFFNCAEITVLPSSTTSVETARPEIAPVTQETNLETESTESNPVEPSSLIQELISRIDSPATKEVATVGPVAQETASPVASPIVQQTTSSPVMRETSHPTMSPTVQETTSPTIPVETTISTNSPVYTVPSENDVLDNIDAESGDLVEVVETAPINSHNAIEDDKLTSIIEGSENSVQVSPLEESDSAGSRSLSSLLVLSLVLIIQQFW